MSRIRNPLHLEIVPAPGTFAWEEQEKRIQSVLPFAESIHIDIVDGKFAPKATFMDPAPFAKYTKQAIFEVHLMVENPIEYIKRFADAGFTRFLGHVEAIQDVTAFLAEAQLYGEAGLAYDGPTPFEKLPVSPEDVDVVNFYTADHAGESGATMDLSKLEKAKLLRSQDPFIAIEIDGGVNDTNIVVAKESGVTRFVTTGFLYKDNVEENFKKLQKLITTT